MDICMLFSSRDSNYFRTKPHTYITLPLSLLELGIKVKTSPLKTPTPMKLLQRKKKTCLVIKEGGF